MSGIGAGRVKLKAHFKDQYNEKLNTEDQIFKPQGEKKKKKWTPNKQRKENFNKEEISVAIEDTIT